MLTEGSSLSSDPSPLPLPSDLSVQQPDILAPEYAGREFITEEKKLVLASCIVVLWYFSQYKYNECIVWLAEMPLGATHPQISRHTMDSVKRGQHE